MVGPELTDVTSITLFHSVTCPEGKEPEIVMSSINGTSAQLAHSPSYRQTALSPKVASGHRHQAQSPGSLGDIWQSLSQAQMCLFSVQRQKQLSASHTASIPW